MNELQRAYMIVTQDKLAKAKDEKFIELQAKIDEAQKNMVQYLATHLPEELQK